MILTLRSILNKTIASVVSAFLLVSVPGPEFYQALAGEGIGIDVNIGTVDSDASAQATAVSNVFNVRQTNFSLDAPKSNFQINSRGLYVDRTLESHSLFPIRKIGNNELLFKNTPRNSQPPAVLLQTEPATNSPAKIAEEPPQPEATLSIPNFGGSIGNTSRIRTHFAALFSFFTRPTLLSDKSDLEVLNSKSSGADSHQPQAYLKSSPSKGPPSIKDNSGQPPLPPTTGDGDHGGGGNNSSRPWRTAMIFTLAAVIIQAGYEAWGSTWPKWMQTNYGITQYSTVAEIEMGARVVSGFAIGWLADKFGTRKSLLGTIGLMAAASTLFLIKAHAHSLPYAQLIILAFTIKFAISSIGTLQQIFPVAIFKDSQGQLKKFNSVFQFIQEIAGIGVPLGIGALLLTFGSLGTMAFQPVTLAIALVALWAFVRISEQKKQNVKEDRPMDSTLLRIGSITYPPFLFLNFMIYSLIAIGYGNFLHPGSSPIDVAAATGVAGKITGLYSFGGLLAMVYMMGPISLFKGIWSRIKQKLPRSKRSPSSLGKETESLSEEKPNPVDEITELRSTVRWMALSAVGLGAFITFLFRIPWLAEAAMIPFGFTQAVSFTQLITLTQSNVPHQKKGKIIGTVRTTAAVLAIGGLYLFGQLFKHFPANATGSVFGYFSLGSMPFLVWLGLLAVVAAYFILNALKLNRYIQSPAFKSKIKR